MRWTYVTVSNDGNECYVADDDLIVFNTPRLAFNHAYSISKAEAEELNASEQKAVYGVPVDKDFADVESAGGTLDFFWNRPGYDYFVG